MANKMERFTQRARRVLSLAQEAAEVLNHNYIGTEHLLVGLMREEGGVAGRVLRDLGAEQQRVETLVEQLTRAKPREGNAPLDLSPGVKRVLELAVDEARRMGHHYIGTEHVLLGLVRQSEGVAIDVLKRLGVSPDEVRRQTRRVLQESPVVQNPSGVSHATSSNWPGRIVSTTVESEVYSRFLMKLLSDLAAILNEREKQEMRQVLRKLYEEMTSGRPFSEEARVNLLAKILAPFKSVEESKRVVHLVVSDKTSGEIYADIKLPLAQVVKEIEELAQVIGAGRTGKLLDINDEENNNIVFSIDDEQQAGTGTA